MHIVVVLMLEPIVGFDAAIPPMCFSEATDAADQPLYRVITATLDGKSVHASNGYSITPEAGAEALAVADTVIIPGTKIPGPRTDGTLPPRLREALATIRPDARLVSICTGAFVLAAAGLLDGRSVTTHWKYGTELRRLYPAVGLVDRVLFTEDGNVYTSAGLAAGLDLCLHLIRKDHGTTIANKVARHCVLPPAREGTQAQFVEAPVPASGGGSTVEVREWVQRNLAANLSVDRLAVRAGMSTRTFNRRFREETGQTPGAWILRLRLDGAREMLEASERSVDAIASDCGFGTGTNMRAHLRRDTGMTPLAYRRAFRDAHRETVAAGPA